MIRGCLIGESLRTGAEFAPSGLRVTRIARIDVSQGAAPGQPAAWTLVDFEADDDSAASLAEAFAESLSPTGGWYADFTTGEDHVVVFAGRVFRYRRGDAAGRAEAVEYGRSVGVPDHQLDWGE